MKLEPISMVLAVLLSASWEPLVMLADVDSSRLASQSFWIEVGAAALHGAATGALAVVALVASAYGIELRRRSARGGKEG
jgi:hypothetical protein